jgi:Cu(I)/Ag(I) efflux system membrane fusion protein
MNTRFHHLGLLCAFAFAVVSCGKQSATEPNDAPHAGHSSSEPPAAEVYTCSMHPQVRLPKPGQCPICQMPLVRASAVKKDNGAPSASQQPVKNMLELSQHAREMAGVETALIEKRALLHEIRTVGKVQYNEAALATITSRVEGYVEKLYVDFTGVAVNPGDHLVDLYSPELVATQQELIFAVSTTKNTTAIEGTRLKLIRSGLTEEQVDEVSRSQRARQELTLFSPIKGTVIEKNVVLKSMVKPGDVLYRLANLDSVWAYLDIYENELSWLQYGQTVEITAEGLQGEKLTGRIWFINPVLSEESRTVKVIVAIENPTHRLKPGMYVSAVLKARMLADGKPAPSEAAGKYTCPMHPLVLRPEAGNCPICQMPLTRIPTGIEERPDAEGKMLAIPVTAVLDSGVRKLTFRELGTGSYEAVELQLGPRSGDFYPVLRGLNDGDRVVVRGGFMLDSQLQIQGLPSLLHPKGQAAGAAGHQHGDGGSAASQAPPAGPSAAPTGHERHANKGKE